MKRRLSYNAYLDKTLGAWIGKSLGGIIGAPVESHKIKGEFTADDCWPSKIYPNDDLDIQVVWMEMMEGKGVLLRQKDLADFWRERCWYNFAEYGSFLYNAQRGIHAPLSGSFNNSFYRESMGCPIRSEIWSIVFCGNGALAAEYAEMDGGLDHIRNSVNAEKFWAAAGAEAFLVDSLEECLLAGCAAAEPDSEIVDIFHTVNALWTQYGNWSDIWMKLVRKYGHRDNSKVEINFAFTLLSLYQGKGDLAETIVTAINCGWDADCTAATAGALVGILNGTKRLPQTWMQKMGDNLTCDVNVRHRSATLLEFAADTCKIGIEAMLVNNSAVEITDIPQQIMNEVRERAEKRTPLDEVYFSVVYDGEPVLHASGESRATLVIHNDGEKKSGALTLRADGNIVFPAECEIVLPEKGCAEVSVSLRMQDGARELADVNLICATFHDGTQAYPYTFGFSGARLWRVYGPYWHAWDTTVSEVCPYRNKNIVTHPVNVPGCHLAMVHNFARLDREYLDEAALVQGELPEEDFVTVERGEDFIDSAHVDGFIGESCYYFARNIRCSEKIKCIVSFGATVPCKIWINGALGYTQEKESAWDTRWFETIQEFEELRIVIKVAKNTDASRIGVQFIKLDVPGDKMKGESYLIDKMSEIL